MRKFEDMGRLKVFMRDPDKKNIFRMAIELLDLTIRKKEIPFYYFKFLYKKEAKNYRDYLSTGECNLLHKTKLLHKSEYIAVLFNKLYFALFAERASIRTPKLISYNFGSAFFFRDRTINVPDQEALEAFFKSVFATSRVDSIFLRPSSAFGGSGCFKVNRDRYKTDLANKYDAFISRNYVHTETIRQHREINLIHSGSANTLRIISLITAENRIEIISATMRFGVGISVVDNASSGGFIVGVDMEYGTLQHHGQYLIEQGGKKVKHHPTSGFDFGGFKIPYFKEACELVIRTVEINTGPVYRLGCGDNPGWPNHH